MTDKDKEELRELQKVCIEMLHNNEVAKADKIHRKIELLYKRHPEWTKNSL